MLKNREDLKNLRDIYSRSLEAQKKKILVCAGTGCVSSGSLEIFDRFVEIMKEKKHPVHC